MIWILLLLIGLAAGIASGLFGIGGGLLIVPALMLLLKFPIHTASAISLVALLLPVGSGAVYEYYTSGKLTVQQIGYGFLIGGAIFIGAFFGSRMALSLNQDTLRKGFAVFLIFAAILTWFK